jgi:hypothetical protein
MELNVESVPLEAETVKLDVPAPPEPTVIV